MQTLEQEITSLESRRIDAEVVCRNLENFGRVFGKLKPERQRELMSLLVQEARCSREKSKIKLTLRPLPDLGWSVDGDKVSFDKRTNWLRA